MPKPIAGTYPAAYDNYISLVKETDLADAFAEVLSMADEIILLPIYPARELPITGVSSQMILNKMTNKNKAIKEKEDLLQWLKEIEIELLITCGAGDIDTIIEPIKQILLTRK